MTTLFPDVAVEFSPTTDPLEDPVWEDITSHLRTFSISRGRSRELDRAEAGLATFLLDNHLGQFDPSKVDGPYYPNIRPMRRIRIQAIPEARWEPFTVGSSFVGGPDVLGGSSVGVILFSGFIETWTQDWKPEPSPTPDATVTVRAVDAFKILALQRGVPSYTGQSGGIVGLILDNQGWSADDRNIEAGGYTVRSVPADDSNANVLATLQEIDASEGGLLFVARDGTITFFTAGHIRANPPAPDQVWGDLSSERQYQSISFQTDESSIWNYVIMSSPYVAGGNFLRDLVSERRYGRRQLDLSTVLTEAADIEARGIAFPAQHSVPREQVTRLEVGVRDDVEWQDILSKDLLDRIVVRRRPLPDQLREQDSVIQGITISSQSRWQWSVVWTLSATPTPNQLTPNQASLDTNTTGWVAVSNCSIAQTAARSNYGTGSMRITATGSGDMSASTTPNNQLAVVPGRIYSATAAFNDYPAGDAGSPDIARDCHVEITWRDSGGSALSSEVGTTALEVGTAGFVSSAATGTAPAGAAFATVQVVVEGAAAGKSHYVDTIGFAEGEQTGWSPGMGT